MLGPAPLIFIGAVVLIAVAALYLDRANSGGHAWSPGAAMRAPARDATNITRHVWRPGAGEDTIRVDVLRARLAAEAHLLALAREQRRKVDVLVQRFAAQYGRHALTEDPPAVDEGQADERAGHLFTHPQSVLNLAA